MFLRHFFRSSPTQETRNSIDNPNIYFIIAIDLKIAFYYPY